MMNDKTTDELLSKKKRLLKKNKALGNRCLEQLNMNAAGIDVGSRFHYVAVPADRDSQSTRRFTSFTNDIRAMAQWLKACRISTVAMESTGVYWMPVYEILSEQGIEVLLVNARHVKNVSGRKSDVQDCEWLQQLHTYGLLRGAFIPDLKTGELRSYVKHRENLLRQLGKCVQHIQKALIQMNLQLTTVINDLTGVTGMKIIRSIIAGERDPKKLAAFRDKRCKKTQEEIMNSLVGHYRAEHIFTLSQEMELYDFLTLKLAACDQEIEKVLGTFETQIENEVELAPKKRSSQAARKHAPDFDVRELLFRVTGVDLTDIPGINEVSALKILSVIGTDMSRWSNEKQFSSWLSLSPNNKVSGEKKLSSRTNRSNNLAATVLRLSAQSLYKSKTGLGAYYRRMRARLGAPKAITAAARKLSCLLYRMLKYRLVYVEAGQEAYEERHKSRVVKNLKRKAKLLGFKLVPTEPTSEKNNIINQGPILSY